MTRPVERAGAVALRWARGVDDAVVAAVQRLLADVRADAGHVVADASGVIVAADDAGCDLLAIDWEHLAGRPVADPRWAQVAEIGIPLLGGRHPVLRALHDGTEVPGDLVGVVVPDAETGGRTVWMEVDAVPVHDADGVTVAVLAAFVDVSDSPRAGRANQRLLTGYRVLAENSSDVVILRQHGHATWASPSVALTLGWRPDELLALPPSEFVHPDDLPTIRAMQREALESGDVTAARVEARFLTASREWRWMRAVGRVIRDDDGRIAAVVDSLHDVQAEHEAREALAESEERYRALVHSVSDTVLRIDAQGVVTWASPAYTSLTGSPPAGVLGRSLLELVERADVADLRRALRRIADGTPQVRVTMRVRRADGAARWAATTITHFRLPDGTREGYVAVIRDVHDEVTARRALAYSEERFRLLADNMGDVVVRWSPTGTPLWVSPSITRTFGWEPEQALVQEHLLHPDDATTRRASLALAARGGVARLRTRLLLPDGGYSWVETTTTAVRTPEGSVEEYVSVIRDVQDQVRYQKRRAARESHYLSIAENAADVVLHLNPGSTVAWVSSAAMERYGWDPGRLVHSSVNTVLHPDDVAKLAAQTSGPGDIDLRVRDGEGLFRWAAAHVRPLLDETGEPAGRVVGLHDVDALVRQRENVAREEQALRELLEGLDRAALLLVGIRDEAGRPQDFRVSFGNARAAALLVAGSRRPAPPSPRPARGGAAAPPEALVVVEGALLSSLAGPSSRLPAACRTVLHTGEALSIAVAGPAGDEVVLVVRPWPEGVLVTESAPGPS